MLTNNIDRNNIANHQLGLSSYLIKYMNSIVNITRI